MRIAVISDIHSNPYALLSVMDDMAQFNVDRIISLGDNIGYGPEPNETVSILIKKNVRSVLGNHELAVLNQNFLSKFNRIAKYTLIKNIKEINKETFNYIKKCTPYISDFGVHFVHGMPPDSQTSYMSRTKPYEIKQMFRRIFNKICFNGHTHFPRYAEINGNEVKYCNLTEGIYELNLKYKYLINAGSVGFPRDGNRLSKYLIFDNSSNKIVVRFVDYDRKSMIKKMVKSGYPEEVITRCR